MDLGAERIQTKCAGAYHAGEEAERDPSAGIRRRRRPEDDDAHRIVPDAQCPEQGKGSRPMSQFGSAAYAVLDHGVYGR